MDHIDIHVMPRKTLTWEEFLEKTPKNSIALDGAVSGGPNFDESTRHANFDHHDNVVREATMSTCKQVFYAVKGGLFESFREGGRPFANVYVNDTDQDTAVAVWLLENYKMFEGTNGLPPVNRLIELTDRLDVTGGAFPMNLNDRLVRRHAWIFEPYCNLRKSGVLAQANETELRDNLEAVCSRISKFAMGQGGEVDLDTRHEILYNGSVFKIVDEIGGNDARYDLYSKGMNAFVSKVAERDDGNTVFSIGRRSRYIPFPVNELYGVYNRVEGLTNDDGWGGSDIIGGSSREHGSKLKVQEIAEITEDYLSKRD